MRYKFPSYDIRVRDGISDAVYKWLREYGIHEMNEHGTTVLNKQLRKVVKEAIKDDMDFAVSRAINNMIVEDQVHQNPRYTKFLLQVVKDLKELQLNGES